MRFTKNNNPSKRRGRHKIDRTTADIIAGKIMLSDAKNGEEKPLNYYDALSDNLCGKKSRGIYD